LCETESKINGSQNESGPRKLTLKLGARSMEDEPM